MKKYKFRLVWIIGLLWLCSFSNAWMITRHLSSVYYSNVKVNTNYWFVVPIWELAWWTYTLDVCVYNLTDYSNYKLNVPYIYQNTLYDRTNTTISSSDFCTSINKTWFDSIMYYVWITPASQITLNGFLFNNDVYFTVSWANIISECPICQECETCPEVDTWSILSWSCDTNYCVDNDLCPVPSNFSTLFINDIEHQSAPVINVTIPREYSRDSSVDSWQFDLVISWYNVDYEYIDWIVRTQNAKPNQTDFNNIVSGLIPLLIPWLVIILFIRFVFKFIKKIL